MDQLRIYMIYFFSLKSLYFSQYNRKWDAVSTSLLWQSEHSLASLGSLFCLWRPVSMARLCPLSLSVFSLVFYQSRWSGTLPPWTLCLGSNTILIYFVSWYHFLLVLRWFGWSDCFWCVWAELQQQLAEGTLIFVQLVPLKGFVLGGLGVTRLEVFVNLND